MLKQNEQIIGIIEEDFIDSFKCSLKRSVYHDEKWKLFKKRWRYNNIIGIDESALSDELSSEDIKKIKQHLKEVYNV